MNNQEIENILIIIKGETKKWKQPVVSEYYSDPYKVLISTIISLRTKDAVTETSSNKLFKLADTPKKMIILDIESISEAIYPAGFYRRKAQNIKEISGVILDKYDGKVPNDLDELLKLKGVGRKTANLTLTVGFNKLGICVDIHVHRILNRLGYIKTKNPDETEMKLREILPKKHWIEINDLLVCYGQNLCKPISPHCSICKINSYCPRVGVEKSR